MISNNGHIPKPTSGGLGISAWTRPECTCGWKGDKVYAVEGDVEWELRSQFEQHIMDERE